ncbi:MAG: uracil-DNA glycosylase [Acidobacteria bacterium]|nr:uracil-DNA glycosylase [Acidobacteriota bacterium]
MFKEIEQQLSFYLELGVTHLNVPLQGAAPCAGTCGPAATLEEIRHELGDCSRCKLCHTRTHIVFGEGNPKAELMFVGEAPGADEDAQGLPFVGRAGQLLTRIIEAIDLKREQVYIANVLKCRPPNNRDPAPDEIEMCRPFLLKQIESIGPKIIVALGKHAAQTLLGTPRPISSLRGKFTPFGNQLLLPTFHPSYLLRNPSAKREVWEDMKKVRDKLKELGCYS